MPTHHQHVSVTLAGCSPLSKGRGHEPHTKSALLTCSLLYLQAAASAAELARVQRQRDQEVEHLQQQLAEGPSAALAKENQALKVWPHHTVGVRAWLCVVPFPCCAWAAPAERPWTCGGCERGWHGGVVVIIRRTWADGFLSLPYVPAQAKLAEVADELRTHHDYSLYRQRQAHEQEVAGMRERHAAEVAALSKVCVVPRVRGGSAMAKGEGRGQLPSS